VNQISSASMVAADCLTANALSTAASVLGLDEGVRLAKLFGAWEHFLVDARGRVESSIPPAAAVADSPVPPDSGNKPALETTAETVDAAAWPTNFQVKIFVNLKALPGYGARRPYTAVWVEDSKQKLVRTITVWGSNWKYLRDLTSWWQAADSYSDMMTQSVTRATRPPGNYVLTWDGLNDKRQPVPQGEYKIFMEINREHGRHATESVTIHCVTDPQSAEFRSTPESDASRVEYGPKPE
jgi:hypothetical protein